MRLRVSTTHCWYLFGTAALCVAAASFTAAEASSAPPAPASAPSASVLSFEAIPADERSLYTIDAKRWFADDDAFRKAIANVRQMAARTAQLKDQVDSDPAVLLRAMEQREQIHLQEGPLFLYAMVLLKQDKSNAGPAREYDDLVDDVDAELGFFEDAVRSLPESQLVDYVRRQPRLSRFHWTFEKWRRARQLPVDRESLLRRLETSTSSWSQKNHEDVLQLAPFGTVVVDGVPKRPERSADFNAMLRNADRAIRESAYVQRVSGYRAAGDALANTLLDVARSDQEVATMRGFSSALDATYFDLYLDAADVDRTLDVFMAHAATAKRFQRASADYVAKSAGLPTMEAWDRDAPLPSEPSPQLTIHEATDALRAATAGFGEDYTHALDIVLDPRNGMLDIVPGPKRSSGDTTYYGVGQDPVFLMEGYTGSLPDVVVLSHEVAHAVHHLLMRRAQVPPAESYITGYVAEGVAKVNELLILDELSRRAKSEPEKTFYLRMLCDKLASVRYTTMYWAVLATRFEVTINRGVPSGSIRAADDVHVAWMSNALTVADSYGDYADNRYLWAATPNFFDTPRQYVKYLYAWVISAVLYQRIQQEPEAARKLVDFMKAGQSSDPVVALKTNLGIDLRDPATIEKALALVEQRVATFEQAIRH